MRTLRGPKRAVVLVLSRLVTLRYRLLLRGKVSFGEGFVCNHRLVISGPGRIVIGNGVNAWAHQEPTRLVTTRPDAVLVVGDGVRLNGPTILASERVEVGDRCILGSAVVFDSDFHSTRRDRATNPDAPVRRAPVAIGRNVWLAGQCAVLPGVTVGEDSVVGFRAVVTRDVPPGVVVAGNPARVVREIED